MKSHIINLEKPPYIPYPNWTIESHIGKGKWKWNPKEVELYLSEKQKTGYVIGHDLRKKLENKPVLNANVLDYLYENQELIPEDWKNKYVYFWGTIYRYSDGDLRVRCLYFHGGVWDRNYNWLGNGWGGDDPAALLANPQNSESLPSLDSRNLELPDILEINKVKYQRIKL